jgi:hypothetical protein
MVISYMWILETNTGATWRSGYLRLVSYRIVIVCIEITDRREGGNYLWSCLCLYCM